MNLMTPFSADLASSQPGHILRPFFFFSPNSRSVFLRCRRNARYLYDSGNKSYCARDERSSRYGRPEEFPFPAHGRFRFDKQSRQTDVGIIRSFSHRSRWRSRISIQTIKAVNRLLAFNMFIHKRYYRGIVYLFYRPYYTYFEINMFAAFLTSTNESKRARKDL